MSSVTQWNLIVLWAVSSGASAQTVHRHTAALPSLLWQLWIHSLPKLYTATGSAISVGLGVEPYFEIGNGIWIGLWNVCALESTDGLVGLSRFRNIVTTAWIERLSWGRGNVQVVYKQKGLTLKKIWNVFQRRDFYNSLQWTWGSWLKERDSTIYKKKYIYFLYSGMALPKCCS